MIYKREILENIWKKIDSSEILLLNGARQVGKTTLMKMIKNKLIYEKGVKPKNIFWYDLEQVDDLSIWNKQISALNDLPINDRNEKYYLFIDEFQRSNEIGSTLKVIHDHYPHIKPIITGSASWYLDIDESMAGRKEVFSIWPLNFSEFTEWNNDKKVKNHYQYCLKNIDIAPKEIIEIVNYSYIKYATYGGYPKIVLSEEKEQKVKKLSEIINSYLTRDIKIWNYTANTLQVKNILILLASQIGSLLQISNLSNNSQLGRTMLINRLELLQNTFILHLINPYFTNKIKEIAKAPKVYLIDSGLSNSLLNTFFYEPKTKNFGHLVENVVATELLKTANVLDNIMFWRTVRGREVDLIKKHENKLIPIEVKSGNIEKIPASIKSFIQKYNSKKAYILNWSIIKEEEFAGCRIYFRPLWWAENI